MKPTFIYLSVFLIFTQVVVTESPSESCKKSLAELKTNLHSLSMNMGDLTANAVPLFMQVSKAKKECSI